MTHSRPAPHVALAITIRTGSGCPPFPDCLCLAEDAVFGLPFTDVAAESWRLPFLRY
jgi:hypothetical protein